jgi:hypothetical protein
MAIRVIKNPENPETPEVLADAIIRIADGFTKLLSTPLTDEAIVILLHGMPGMQVGKTEIRLVLKNLRTLKGYYIRSTPRSNH